jgi:hypothetical protein
MERIALWQARYVLMRLTEAAKVMFLRAHYIAVMCIQANVVALPRDVYTSWAIQEPDSISLIFYDRLMSLAIIICAYVCV